MIARLRGTPAGRAGDGLVLDVGGVGYLVLPTRRAARLAREGAEVTLQTYLHVREDTMQLFGFADADERELFEHLLSVSGVGPKVALAIVSGSTPDELRRAIALEDTARFQAIPGIGKKTAQRVVLELKEKLGDAGSTADAPEPGPQGAPHLVAREALMELGYSLVEADRALMELGYSLVEADRALADVDPDLSPEERVRRALKRAA